MLHLSQTYDMLSGVVCLWCLVEEQCQQSWAGPKKVVKFCLHTLRPCI